MIWAKPNFKIDKNMSQADIEARFEKIKNTIGFLDIPDSWVFMLSCIKILAKDYGFIASKEQNKPCDGNGHAIPLYSYPMIEYLRQLDYTDKSVFEYGAGQSSIFWRERAGYVVSVENNPGWYDQIKDETATNQEIIFRKEQRAFIDSILEYDNNFDVIIVDGAENRYECAVNALKKLNSGGFIILDNSDWYPKTAAYLRNNDLVQIDMSGFKPTNHHASTTSLFLRRDFNFKPAGSRQPVKPVGGMDIHSDWDDRLY